MWHAAGAWLAAWVERVVGGLLRVTSISCAWRSGREVWSASWVDSCAWPAEPECHRWPAARVERVVGGLQRAACEEGLSSVASSMTEARRR